MMGSASSGQDGLISLSVCIVVFNIGYVKGVRSFVPCSFQYFQEKCAVRDEDCRCQKECHQSDHDRIDAEGAAELPQGEGVRASAAKGFILKQKSEQTLCNAYMEENQSQWL